MTPARDVLWCSYAICGVDGRGKLRQLPHARLGCKLSWEALPSQDGAEGSNPFISTMESVGPGHKAWALFLILSPSPMGAWQGWKAFSPSWTHPPTTPARSARAAAVPRAPRARLASAAPPPPRASQGPRSTSGRSRPSRRGSGPSSSRAAPCAAAFARTIRSPRRALGLPSPHRASPR